MFAWFKRPPLTIDRLSREVPELVAQLRDEGAAAELRRVRGVYEAVPYPRRLEALTERLMFDGKTQPHAAALAFVAAMQAIHVIFRDVARAPGGGQSTTSID